MLIKGADNIITGQENAHWGLDNLVIHMLQSLTTNLHVCLKINQGFVIKSNLVVCINFVIFMEIFLRWSVSDVY